MIIIMMMMMMIIIIIIITTTTIHIMSGSNGAKCLIMITIMIKYNERF